MSILFHAFFSYGAKYKNQMVYPTWWPHSPALLKIFIWNCILKIGWDIAIQIFNFVCCLAPQAHILSTMTTLGSVKHLDISNVFWKFQRNRPSSFWDTALLSLSSAMSAQRGLLTHLCFRCTNIVFTAKRSYCRTLPMLQTILFDFWNLLQVLLRPKNA